MAPKKNFWIGLCLINLAIVALLGLILRSKIVFSIPFINFRNALSAHSHFAFAGWAGLTLMTLLIYDLLPGALSQKKIYQWVLGGIEVSSLGMAFSFPFFGYNIVSIFFSTLYILVTLVFAPVFIKDILRSGTQGSIKLLSVSAIVSLFLSFSGTLGLLYILSGGSANSLLYRDSIYTFLHFQYNGFFTLSVIALFLNALFAKGVTLGKQAKWFSVFLCLSIIPTLFLSLLWHNMLAFYILAGIGCLMVIVCLFYFVGLLRSLNKQKLFTQPLAYTLWVLSIASFILKMSLNVGTIFPSLGNAVYGDHPLIIGFLHLVFLGFLTFFILSSLLEKGFYTIHQKPVAFPFIVFATGILANELLLMLQGLSILLQTNSTVFTWLLLLAAVILFVGAVLLAAVRFKIAGMRLK